MSLALSQNNVQDRNLKFSWYQQFNPRTEKSTKQKKKKEKKIKPIKQNKHLRNELLVEKKFGGGWGLDRIRVEVHESEDWVRVERVRESGDWAVERVSKSGGVRVERVSMTFEFWITPLWNRVLETWFPSGFHRDKPRHSHNAKINSQRVEI